MGLGSVINYSPKVHITHKHVKFGMGSKEGK